MPLLASNMHIDKLFIIFTVALVATAMGGITVLSSSSSSSSITTVAPIPVQPISDDPRITVADTDTTDTTTKSEPISKVPAKLLDKQEQAYKNFLERNNFHQIRVSEYEKYWGNAVTDAKLNQILENIKHERVLIESFVNEKQAKQAWYDTRDEFRQTNDKIVSDLTNILISEYNYHISQTTPYVNSNIMMQISGSLSAQKSIASKITATSFPVVTEQQSKLSHIATKDKEVHAPELVLATVVLGEETEKNIMLLEINNIPVKPRHDIKEVGENKNTLQVLFSIIKCQQELRINAENYIDAKIEISKYYY